MSMRIVSSLAFYPATVLSVKKGAPIAVGLKSTANYVCGIHFFRVSSFGYMLQAWHMLRLNNSTQQQQQQLISPQKLLFCCDCSQ